MILLNHSPVTAQISQEFHDEFKNHVQNSCLCPKVMTYFSTGIAEECSEFLDVVNLILKERDRIGKEELNDEHNNKLNDLVRSEAGDIMWYMYALTFSLPGGQFFETDQDEGAGNTNLKPVTCLLSSRIENGSIEGIFKDSKSTDSQKLNDLKNGLCSSMGKLCGSVKKFSRGDKKWDVFYERIQRDVNNLLLILSNCLFCLSVLLDDKNLSLESAMRCNVQKIANRMSKGTIKGDGEVR